MHQSKQTFKSDSERISEGMKVHTYSLPLAVYTITAHSYGQGLGRLCNPCREYTVCINARELSSLVGNALTALLCSQTGSHLATDE